MVCIYMFVIFCVVFLVFFAVQLLFLFIDVGFVINREVVFFFFKQKTAYEWRIIDWSSDVCSSDLFWGATVITNLFSAIPVVGDAIVSWLLGGFAVDNAALNRFFSLHFLLPFVIAGVVILHIWALHIPGSSNPTGVEVKGR